MGANSSLTLLLGDELPKIVLLAAESGDNLKKFLGWPEKLCSTETSKERRLKKKIEELEKQLKEYEDAAVKRGGYK